MPLWPAPSNSNGWIHPKYVTIASTVPVEVSNGSKDVFDLTVVIVAVADNGRATAIGYQRFPLNPGANNVPITFGNTLPPGPYVVHVDAIAEIAARNSILRRRLQTPQPLQIVGEP